MSNLNDFDLDIQTINQQLPPLKYTTMDVVIIKPTQYTECEYSCICRATVNCISAKCISTKCVTVYCP